MNPAFAGFNGGVLPGTGRPQFAPGSFSGAISPGGSQLAQQAQPNALAPPSAGDPFATPDYGIPPSLASRSPRGFYDPTPVYLNFNAGMGGGPGLFYEGGRYDDNGVFRDVWSNQANNFNRPRQPYIPDPRVGNVPIFGGGGR